jgi:ATP-dependent helicase/nuclease subunit A
MNPELLELTDQTDRTLIEQELEENIFVEAGAGSGKTHELVERICAMVDAGVELKSVAAITFTEKAAGELRERVRRQLTDASPTDQRRRALDQLDTAPIGTIHSFAARIISEHPIEAGVPPLITVVDELRSQIAFTRRWEDARQKLFADASLDTHSVYSSPSAFRLTTCKTLRQTWMPTGTGWKVILPAGGISRP